MSISEISVAMLTKNSEKYLEEVLTSLEGFGEVVLLDNGSVDQTFAISKRFSNVRIVEHDFIGFGPMKNLAIENCKFDWVLSLDSDEVLTLELKNTINNLNLNANEVYSLNRINHYQKKPIKACGWYPDVIPRLFHKSTTRFNNKMVHESLEIPTGAKLATLRGDLLHYSFDGASDLLNKLQQYTSLFALEQKGKKKSSVLKAIVRAKLSFLKFYVFKKGFLYGYEGFIISYCNALGVFFKYIKLYEENRK